MIAANAEKQFRSILLCELKASDADALEERLKKTGSAGKCQVFRGDCNTRIEQIASQIPAKVLTLAFIDPEALHVSFATIQKLAARGRVDLLILFADYMDIVRNVDTYFSQRISNLDRMLGPSSTWRQQWTQLVNRTPVNICKLFADDFRLQLKEQLGYVDFREKVMTAPNGPIYRLIFASKHERGGEFWDKITKRDRSGQQEMFGSP